MYVDHAWAHMPKRTCGCKGMGKVVIRVMAILLVCLHIYVFVHVSVYVFMCRHVYEYDCFMYVHMFTYCICM